MNNKKWVPTLLAGVMTLGLLSGCAGGSNTTSGGNGANTPSNRGAATNTPSASEPIKLTMWGGVPPESGPQAVVDAWNAENPEVQVEYVRFVNDDDGNLKLDTAMLTDQGVDIYVNYTLSQTEKRVEAGVALDLSEFSDYDIDDKMGPDAALWKIDDKYYGVPTKKNAFFVALNKDMLDEAGLEVPKSWTWDEARDYAKQLTADGRYGLIQHLEPFYDPMDSVLEKDGYAKADGSSNLDHPLIQQWLETLNAMMTEDASTPPLGEQMSTQLPVDTSFLGGQAAMLNIGEWLIRSSNNLTDFPRDFKIAFAPVPRLADAEADFITRGGLGDLVSINAKSPHKEAAWEFVKWYADGGMAPMAAGGRLPASKDVDKQVALDSLLGDQADTYDLESLEYVLYEDTTPTYVRSASQQVIDLRTQEYEKYFLGGQTVEKTIENMVARHNELLK
ncbi:ABC transporter substrate-binding protein [Paenibacillus sp. 1P07SE]|uniref:ABC transporter substrate-binding protein n=1 Tax=Paenibacillus sp. 1P07SE TaxID=3132209 RepID=UPI0039A6D4BD